MTNLEQAAIAIHCELTGMENMREFCGAPDWTQKDERDYIELCEIFNKIQLIRRRREEL